MNVKAITDFTGYAGDALWRVGETIHNAMALAAATFTAPPVTMAILETATDDVRTKLLAKASGAHADTVAFNVARADFEDKLSSLGGYVNGLAQGNETIVVASGFPYYPTVHPPDYSAPDAPTNVVVRQGDVSGSLLARYRTSRRPSTNEVQTCTGDPTVEANWKTVGFYSGGRANVPGIVPGSTVWVRIRTIGLNSVMSDWSDPAKIMVV